jgi:hypothetical protein
MPAAVANAVRGNLRQVNAYDHYDTLRTLEDLAGLTTHAGAAAGASDITGIWN